MITSNVNTSMKGVNKYTLSSDNYEYQTSGNLYAGMQNTYDGYPPERRRIYADSLYVGDATGDNTTVAKLFLNISGNLLNAEGTFAICYAKYAYTGSTEKELFEFCGNAIEVSYTNAIWSNTGAKIEITNTTAAKNILKYGLVIREKEGVVKTNRIQSVTARALYYTELSAADIYMKTTVGDDGKWRFPEIQFDVYGPSYWAQRIDRDLRLSWECVQPYSAQSAYEIGINDKSGSEITVIVAGTTDKDVTLDRNIWRKWFNTEKQVYIYIRVKTANGVTSDWKMVTVSCYLHDVVNPKPNAETIKYEDANTFTWDVEKRDTGETVIYADISGYSIECSTNNGATFSEIAIENGANTSCVIAGYMLPVGKIVWRVTPLYDNNEFRSLNYAEGVLIVGADPVTSTVSCDGKPIPTISWESVAQSSYQVRFGDYDSGAVYSSDKYHKIPYFYKDGVYEVTVRTQISTGEWSEWSEPVYVQITNIPPQLGITSTAEMAGYRVKVVWTKNNGYVDYIVYRNGVPIHVTDGGVSTEGGYMDSMANGVSAYMVRGITSEGYYDQSEEIKVNATVKTDILFMLGSDEILPMKYTPTFPRAYNYAAEMAVTYRYFAGRTKPVAITSGQISKSLPLSYIDKGRTLARKLLGYVGKTVVFKDSGGDMMIGILNMVNAGMGNVSTTTFQITEVDYNERVEYLP